MIQNAVPATKLTTLTNVISTRKPVRLSERCGVNSAENSFGSCAGSKSLPAVIACQYTPFMAKIIRAQRAKKSSVHFAAKKPAKKAAAKPLPKSTAKKSAKKSQKPKPWTPAEVHATFIRFPRANPEPRGELEHLNPYTLLG